MKHHFFYFYVVLISLMSLASCSDIDSVDETSYLGKWELISVMGQGDLGVITGVIIDESTITMTFREDSHYTALYDKYGDSNTVEYIYNEHDSDSDGNEGVSLTFDEPLYFEEYSSGNEYVTKVFIDVKNGKRLSWHNETSTHVMLFER